MHNKTDILIVAASLFSQRGYHHASMRDLAGALGLKSASLYSHIGSKEELLWEIVNHVAGQFLAQAENVPQTLPPEQQITLLVRGHMELMARELSFVRVFFHEWQYLKPSLRDKIKMHRDAYEARFQSVIEKGVKQGVFQVEDTRIACLFVLSAMNWSYQWLDPAGFFTVEDLAHLYITLILDALGAESDD